MTEYKIARGKTRMNLYRRAELRYVTCDTPCDAWMKSLRRSPASGPQVLVDALRPRYAARTTEHIGVISLSGALHVLGYTIAAIGGDAEGCVSPADVLRFLVLSGARSFVLFHNHPSGSLEWTSSDLRLTTRFANLGALLHIQLLDHLLLTPSGEWISMQETQPDALRPDSQ